MKMTRYSVTLLHVPADLRADPDGDWSYEALVATAGLDPDSLPPPIVAALMDSWRGHPEGSAVVASPGEGWIAVIECGAADQPATELVPAPVIGRSVSRAA